MNTEMIHTIECNGNDKISKSVIIDHGKNTCKIGFGGEDKPSSIIPSIVGYEENYKKNKDGNTYVGNEAQLKKGILNIKPIINDGHNINWDEIEILWNHCFYNELKIKPEEESIFLIKPEFSEEKETKEKMAEIMFEKYNVPFLYISVPSLLTLHSCNLTRGMVVDLGESETHIVSIHDGYKSNAINLKFGGNHLSHYMLKLLEQNHSIKPSMITKELAENVKEKLGYVSLDFEGDMKSLTLSSSLEQEVQSTTHHHGSSGDKKKIITIGAEMDPIKSSPQPPIHESSYLLPDGKVVIIDKECFRCPEALFKPYQMGILSDGIHQSIYNSINKNNIINEKELLNGIVLTGGTSLFPGLKNRLKKELTILEPQDITINIITPSEPKYSAFIGGSMLASKSTKQMWISKKEYDEYGLSITHTK